MLLFMMTLILRIIIVFCLHFSVERGVIIASIPQIFCRHYYLCLMTFMLLLYVANGFKMYMNNNFMNRKGWAEHDSHFL